MKQQLFLLATLVFTILRIDNIYSQNLLKTTGSMYEGHTVTSMANHHLKVYDTFRKETRILGPYESWVRKDEFYSKARFRKTKLKCFYNQETYELDKKAAYADEKNKISRLEKNREDRHYNNHLVMAGKLGAISIRETVHVNRDDGFFMRGLKNIARGGSWAYEKTRDVIENTEAISNISSLGDLLFFLDEKFGIQASELDKFSASIEEAFELSKEASKKAINATIYWAKSSQSIEVDYYERLDEIEKEREARLRQIKSYLDDSNFEERNVYRMLDIAEDISFKTKTPNVLLNITPLHFGGKFNDDWQSEGSEAIVKDINNDGEADFAGGLLNRNALLSAKFSLSPEIALGTKSLARLYLGVSYFNTSYGLTPLSTYSNSFFSTTPQSPEAQLVIHRPITFNHQRLSSNLTLRLFMNENISMDFEAGYSQNSGYVNLRKSGLSDGYEWAVDRIDMPEEYYDPYVGIAFGIGDNTRKGGHLTIGANAYKLQNFSFSNSYRLTNQDSEQPVSFNPQSEYTFRVYAGFTLSF